MIIEKNLIILVILMFLYSSYSFYLRFAMILMKAKSFVGFGNVKKRFTEVDITDIGSMGHFKDLKPYLKLLICLNIYLRNIYLRTH